MKLIYTVVTDNYDLLKAPIIPPSEDTRMVALVLHTPGVKLLHKHQNIRWQVVVDNSLSGFNSVLASRVMKFNPWLVALLAGVDHWDVAWYVDATYTIQGASSSGIHKSPGEMFEMVDRSWPNSLGKDWDLFLQKHPFRGSVKEEVEKIESSDKFDGLHKFSLSRWVKSTGYIGDNELFMNGSFLVKNNDKSYSLLNQVSELCVDMFFDTGVVRDQVVMPIALEKARKSGLGPVVGVLDSTSMHVMLEQNLHNEIDLPSIEFSVPYSVHGDLGSAYNRFFHRLRSNYGVAMDMDFMFTDSRAGKRIARTILEDKHRHDVYVCLTNHLNNEHQCASGEVDDDNDLDHHAAMEKTLWKISGTTVVDWDVSWGYPAGMFMCMKRSTWSKVKFIPGLKGVDWDFFHRAFEMNLKVGLMTGIYGYHWHRGEKGKKWTHL